MTPMNPWFGKAAFLVCLVAFCVIRTPHGQRHSKVAIAEDRKGTLEIWLLISATLGTVIIPIVWVSSSLFEFAEYELLPAIYWPGIVVMLLGLWLFHRSHVDLGTNWSVTLQMRENHALITNGVYNKIRHPMYSSMFLLAIAQALFVPNWIAGPAYFVGFGLLYVLRVGVEERMMFDRFGSEYVEYKQRTGRLMPRL